jgi:transcriptional regulator with XRE-family HTH domain
MREIMKLKRITQEDLEEMTGIKQSEISRIMNEEKEIWLKTAKKIAKALGKPIEYIWPD